MVEILTNIVILSFSSERGKTRKLPLVSEARGVRLQQQELLANIDKEL